MQKILNIKKISKVMIKGLLTINIFFVLIGMSILILYIVGKLSLLIPFYSRWICADNLGLILAAGFLFLLFLIMAIEILFLIFLFLKEIYNKVDF